VAKPAGLDDILVYEEGDEIIDANAQIIEHDKPALPPLVPAGGVLPTGTDDALAQGDLGQCHEHKVAWVVQENRFGNIQAFHVLGQGEFCQFGKMMSTQFQGGYEARFGAFRKSAADAWLKDHFNGKTWSKMEPRQMLEAVVQLTTLPSGPPVLPAGTETAAQPPEEGELPDTPPEGEAGQETAHGLLPAGTGATPDGDGEYQKFLASQAAEQEREREARIA
jgi:hypothetical protein